MTMTRDNEKVCLSVTGQLEGSHTHSLHENLPSTRSHAVTHCLKNVVGDDRAPAQRRVAPLRYAHGAAAQQEPSGCSSGFAQAAVAAQREALSTRGAKRRQALSGNAVSIAQEQIPLSTGVLSHMVGTVL
jgi:hypothetical protein